MTGKVLAGRLMLFTVLLCLATIAVAQMPQTTTEKVPGAGKVTTQELKGEVVYVEGNSLVVKMASGEVRTFNVPESRRFIVDGKELTVHELKPGTRLTATVTTTTTPVTVRTTTVGSGTVWYVMGKNVVLTMPDGQNRQYTVKDETRFTVNGNPATVNDLKRGMVVSAEKVVEEPMTEIATDTKVVGQAPAPRAAPKTEPAPAVAQAKPMAPPPEKTEAPATLPKTASPVPLIGLLGALFVLSSFGIQVLRRS